MPGSHDLDLSCPCGRSHQGQASANPSLGHWAPPGLSWSVPVTLPCSAWCQRAVQVAAAGCVATAPVKAPRPTCELTPEPQGTAWRVLIRPHQPSLPRSSALRSPRPSRGSLLCGGHCPPTACCTRNCARGAAEQGPLGLTGFQAQLRPGHQLQRGRETLRTTGWSPDPPSQGGDLSLSRAACLSTEAEASGQVTWPACPLLSQRGSRWGSCRPSLPELCAQTRLCHSSPERFTQDTIKGTLSGWLLLPWERLTGKAYVAKSELLIHASDKQNSRRRGTAWPQHGVPGPPHVTHCRRWWWLLPRPPAHPMGEDGARAGRAESTAAGAGRDRSTHVRPGPGKDCDADEAPLQFHTHLCFIMAKVKTPPSHNANR